MKRYGRLLLPVAVLAALAGPGPGLAGSVPGTKSPAQWGYEVIKLPAGSAELRAAGHVVQLGPGSAGWSVPLETQVLVIAGGIWTQFGDLTLKAWPGDAFRFMESDGVVRVEAIAGKLIIARPDGTTRQLDAGQWFTIPPPAGASDSTDRRPPGGCGPPLKRGGP